MKFGDIRLLIGRFILGLPRPSRSSNISRLKKKGLQVQSFKIREADTRDIPALYRLHVRTWSETYWTVRKPPTYRIREFQWKEQFKKNKDSWFCFVIEINKELVGFANARIHFEDKIKGELNKIYLLREYQRLGLGTKILREVAGRFLSFQISSMKAFVEPLNPSGYFFEKTGGRWLIEQDGKVNRNWYYWKNLANLVAAPEQGRNQCLSD